MIISSPVVVEVKSLKQRSTQDCMSLEDIGRSSFLCPFYLLEVACIPGFLVYAIKFMVPLQVWVMLVFFYPSNLTFFKGFPLLHSKIFNNVIISRLVSFVKGSYVESQIRCTLNKWPTISFKPDPSSWGFLEFQSYQLSILIPTQ